MSPLTPLQLFKNLSDETRLTLVLLLKERQELCVCELSAILQLPQPKISRPSGAATQQRFAERSP